MARAELRLILLGLAATSVLAGCVGGTGSGTARDGEAAGFAASPRKAAGNRETEAPDIFQTTDSALWDGRPSLGGIWVASPDVTDPERVVMLNPATGKTVNGALFRRERENPGPTLQLSSDAAEALGILAGQPTEIRVTALRKEDVDVPTEVDAAATDPGPAANEGAAEADGAAPDAAAAETAALAAAALDVADGTATAVEAAEGTAEAVIADEPPRKKTRKERRAEAKAMREAEKAAKAAAAAGIAPVEGAAVADTPVDPAASAVATIETVPLDATATAAPVEVAPVEVATPAPAPEKKTRRQIRAEEEAAAAAAAAAPAPVEVAPIAPGGRSIQIACFSKEENARRAVEALAKIDIPAQTQQSERSGKAVWGVVAKGDVALLTKIKAAGFADAYFLQ